MNAPLNRHGSFFDEQLIEKESKSEINCGIRQNKTQGHLLININTDTVTSIIYRPDSSQKNN